MRNQPALPFDAPDTYEWQAFAFDDTWFVVLKDKRTAEIVRVSMDAAIEAEARWMARQLNDTLGN